jgi:hypothetical protein
MAQCHTCGQAQIEFHISLVFNILFIPFLEFDICLYFLQFLFNPCYGSQRHFHYWYGPNSSMHIFHSCNFMSCQFQLMLMFP